MIDDAPILLTYKVTEFLDASRGATNPRRGNAQCSGIWQPDHDKKQIEFKIRVVIQDVETKQVLLKMVAKALFSVPGLLQSKMDPNEFGADYQTFQDMAREAYERTTAEIAMRAKADYLRHTEWPDASTLDWFGPGGRLLEMWGN